MNILPTRKPRILVCGDIMLDHNITVQIEKIANEAPIPVYNFINEDFSLGGCGNVLKNLCSLGCEKLHIVSAVGNDKNGQLVNAILSSMDISNHTVVVDNYNTTVKRRYFCDNKIMFRCDIENVQCEKDKLTNYNLYSIIENILQIDKIDCIILSDYNKGVLTYEQCQSIIKLANKNGIFTCVDPKENSDKYIGCSLIKPNRSEAYKLFKIDKSKPIIDVHNEIFRKIRCKYSIVTMSENGITLFDGKELYHQCPNVHKIIDVTGAGDIVCSMLGYYLWNDDIPLNTFLRLTTDIATKSVEFPGTYTITTRDIHEAILKHSKLIDIYQLPILHDLYSNKKIVFTNGCFDLLHKGHIETFKFCKGQGDIVIVGLNSDNSIKHLKGPTRPIHTLDIRIAVLSAISYIDYIIVFDDDTPYNVIKALRPHYLVKGADYKAENIIGREFVNKVLLCPLVDGVSTTNTIKNIQTY